MFQTRRCFIHMVIVGGLLVTDSSLGEDWPHWRGPGYDGHSAEKNFKTAWDDPPKTAWEHPIGAGYSGIAVVDGRVYTCGQPDGEQVLYCLDATSGKVVWETPFERAYHNNTWNGPRCTPTVNKDRVYVVGAQGTVACFKAATGKRVWGRQYKHVPQWGYSGSVLIQGKLAIVCTGGKDGALRALNKNTGEEIGKCGGDKHTGYSTPYPFEFEGGRYVCGFFGSSVIIADRKTGREVFSMPWKTDYKVNAATPIFHDGYLFLSSGYKTGCGVFKLSKDGDRLTAEKVWRSKKMRNKFQTPVLYRGKLYAFDQRGFKCLDFMTGDVQWNHRGGEYAHGSLVLANKHLVALSPEGELRIGKASPKRFNATGRAQILDGQCWTVPTLSNGRLYARNHKRIVCVDLRLRPEAQARATHQTGEAP